MFAATGEWCIAPDAGLDADAALLGVDWPARWNGGAVGRVQAAGGNTRNNGRESLRGRRQVVAATEAERLAAVAAVQTADELSMAWQKDRNEQAVRLRRQRESGSGLAVVVAPASPVVNRHKASHHAVTVAPKAALATLPGGHPKAIAMAPAMVVVHVNRIPCAPALMP